MSTALELAVRLPLDRFELDVDLVARRPTTAIFGPSGAGKTSLLEAVAGLRRAAGRVALDGAVWLDTAAGVDLPPERRRVGYVPQDGLLFPHLDVRANLLAGARRAGGSGLRVQSAGTRRAAELGRVAGLLGLEPLLDRSVEGLSGGERQRVALGRALCSAPDLLLLDEPLAALDLPLRRRLLPFLRRVRAELTVPMLLVSHDPLEVQALADEVVVLAAGRVVARGEPRRVLTDPRVFPLVEEGEPWENVVAGRVERVDGETGGAVVRLGGANGPELLAAAAAPPGEEVLVGVPASDVLVATVRPEGLSARNVLAAEVTEVEAIGRRRLVTARLEGAAGGGGAAAGAGAPHLVAEVTEAVPALLGLAPGRRIYLVIKATSCRLYAEAAAGARAP